MSWDNLSEIDACLAAAEENVPNLREGVHRRVVWHGDVRVKTAISILYIHGFSATSEESRPFPDDLAAGLGANIHYARLRGHGQDGHALGQATFAQWRADTLEAIEIARAIGDRVLIIGCSTGASQLVDALVGNERDIAACIFVSANFGIASKLLKTLLSLPFARNWGPYIFGKERSFPPRSPEHAAFWTTTYDTVAGFTMNEAVKAAAKVNVGQFKMPAAFIYCAEDEVVEPQKIVDVINKWGGPTEVLTLPKGQDALGHLIIGKVRNPDQTAQASAFALEFCNTHL